MSVVAEDRIVGTLVRMPASQVQALKDEYASSYHEHRMSFNAWLIAMIRKGIEG